MAGALVRWLCVAGFRRVCPSILFFIGHGLCRLIVNVFGNRMRRLEGSLWGHAALDRFGPHGDDLRPSDPIPANGELGYLLHGVFKVTFPDAP